MKIIDRVKAYIQQKKGSDQQSTGDPLDGESGKQNRDDKKPAVSTAHDTPEPDPAAEPTTEAATEPVTEAAAEPAAEAVTEPAAEPVTEAAAEPVTEAVTEPAAEAVTEAATAPGACPRCGATGDAPCTTPSGKATKTHKGRE